MVGRTGADVFEIQNCGERRRLVFKFSGERRHGRLCFYCHKCGHPRFYPTLHSAWASLHIGHVFRTFDRIITSSMGRETSI